MLPAWRLHWHRQIVTMKSKLNTQRTSLSLSVSQSLTLSLSPSLSHSIPLSPSSTPPAHSLFISIFAFVQKPPTKQTATFLLVKQCKSRGELCPLSLSLFLSLPICMCVCVVGQRVTMDMAIEWSVSVCAYVCVSNANYVQKRKKNNKERLE